jgi:arylsulfatase A-like enzyme
MKNQSIVTLLFSLLALQFAGCSNELLTTPAASSKKLEKPIDTSASRPNIIFYLADDQDITDYGVYGNEKVHTPSVDRLAREGIMFKHAFTAQAICAPSRTQLFTGKYPLKNGAFANHTPTRPNIKSVTKQMRALGYEVFRETTFR